MVNYSWLEIKLQAHMILYSSGFFLFWWSSWLGKKAQTLLSWEERYKVAVGIAEALDYLHGGSAQPVIHRDVKSSNILLGDDFEPQVLTFSHQWRLFLFLHMINT